MSVLAAVARGDVRIATLMETLDAQGRPFVIPSLAITGAALTVRGDDAGEILEGLATLGSISAPLAGAEQALALARVITRTGLEPWDAHAAAVADASVCPILTLDAPLWRAHANDLDEPLHFREIADPDGA